MEHINGKTKKKKNKKIVILKFYFLNLREKNKFIFDI